MEKETSIEMNSGEYWEKRFATGDWNNYGGEEQSQFFSQVALDHFPKWFLTELKESTWSFHDYGCAEGAGTARIAQFFPNMSFKGLDISPTAVEKARQRHPHCEFSVADVVEETIERADIIFSSNVLEHFHRPFEILEKLTRAAEKYAVFMLPFEDTLEIDEHFYIFTKELFSVQVGTHYLESFRIIDCRELPGSFWPGLQLMLIYTNPDHKPWQEQSLQHFYDSNCLPYEETAQKAIDRMNAAFEKELLRQDEIEDLRRQLAMQEMTRQEIEELEEKNIEYLVRASRNYSLAKNQSIQWMRANQIIRTTQDTVGIMMGSSAFRLLHLWDRIKSQLMLGNIKEKKNFFKWFFSRKKNNFGNEHQPLARILRILEQAPEYNMLPPMPEGLHDHLICEKDRYVKALEQPMSKKAITIRRAMDERDYKGILIYPHTVHWEPLQTPQQLLRAFARQGWLCFFCENPEIEDNFGEVEPNVFVVPEVDFLQAVQETHVTVMLTWMGSLSFVDNIASKQIWYHILDKLDIFPHFGPLYMELSEKMVRESEVVSYVSYPLQRYTGKRDDALYLPNGVAPQDLLGSGEGYIPTDLAPILNTNHKIIGYLGYLAEWMDYKLVYQVAQARPEYEFVFIGKSIHDTFGIENLPNVHLLGLKPYRELASYARHFDVATIPFVVNDAMNCVSPIKFYEYCTLGLPIISSYMEEVEAYKNEYIACFNTKEEYLRLLDDFVQPEIKAAAQKAGSEIGRKNTWDSRAQTIQELLELRDSTALLAPYRKHDVIVLSVIDFDFRYQRPQHFAAQFAERGHRVFYINANHFNPDTVTLRQDNLYIVDIHNNQSDAIHLTDWAENLDEMKSKFDMLARDYFIRDAVVFVDYPNWVHGAKYLREKYGFKLITDYMDDFTGFLNPAADLVHENCLELLRTSDGVVASSEFLHNIAVQYNDNTTIVRNGTEVDHFVQAYGTKRKNSRPVVGYYGAVAEWFDADKVLYVAQQLPDCDVVIVGAVTANQEKLAAQSNIHLKGEKPYAELTEYLSEFDVCLIPFDTSTDLIKATNPVKFYEYLSAGKKIVATEIPELLPYKDTYVYMANDNKQFLEYVKQCLAGQDTLCSPEKALQMGKQNDWITRYEQLEVFCKETVPLVSIIVLTYNNLTYNKLCVESILEKTAYPNYELIIVDNASQDETPAWLRELESQKIPGVKIILNTENKGFAAGNNVGIHLSKGKYIVLLNNDTVVTRGWLTSLVKHLENDPAMGMSGSVTNSIGNEAKIKVDYGSFAEMERFANRYTFAHMGKTIPNPNVLAMFSIAIKREVVDKCGGLDEGYICGMFEDDDYAQAVKHAGYHLCIAEDSFVHHFLSVSFDKLENKEFTQLFNQNRLRFEQKWHTQWVPHSNREGVFPATNTDIKLL